MCSIEHAREKFDDLFVSGAASANSLLESREQFLQKFKQDPLSEADSLKAVKNWCGEQRRTRTRADTVRGLLEVSELVRLSFDVFCPCLLLLVRLELAASPFVPTVRQGDVH